MIKEMKAKSLSDDQKIQDFSSLIKTLQENLAVDKIKIGKMQEEQKKLMEDNKNPQSMNEELKESASCQANAACITDKFDVLRGRLLGNHNDFHWQLGGQINHQPCSYKAARVIR